MYPVLFEFGPVVIRFYGLMYVIALLVGVRIISRESDRLTLGLSREQISNYSTCALISGIIGARIYYVVFNWSYYAQNLIEIPAIWHGGLAIHGGVLAGFLFTFWYVKNREISLLGLGDAVAPALILGQAFGRFGNFMNGDAHGTATSLPWGVVFPAESIAGQEFPGQPIHPTMLYELLLNFCWFWILWGLRKKPHKDGFIAGLYVLLYSVGRFVVSFFRADSLMLGNLRAAQVISLILVIVVGFWIIKGRFWVVSQNN